MPPPARRTTASGAPSLPPAAPGAGPAFLVVAGATPGCGCTSAVAGLCAALK